MEVDVLCVAFDEKHGWHRIVIGWINDSGEWVLPTNELSALPLYDYRHEVKHWMPLPEIPESYKTTT